LQEFYRPDHAAEDDKPALNRAGKEEGCGKAKKQKQNICS